MKISAYVILWIQNISYHQTNSKQVHQHHIINEWTDKAMSST